jgi:hypothetical protein
VQAADDLHEAALDEREARDREDERDQGDADAGAPGRGDRLQEVGRAVDGPGQQDRAGEEALVEEPGLLEDGVRG